MRIIHITASFAVAAVLAAGIAGAAGTIWNETGAPQGGSVAALARGDDGVFYAGTLAGVFTSRDGVAWQPGGAFPGVMEDPDVTAVAAAAKATAYAVVAQRLFKTSDGAATWQRVGDGIDPAAAIISVGVAPGRPDVVYAGTYLNRTVRVHRSDNGGKTWSPTSYGLDEGGTPGVIAVDPASSATAYVGTSNTSEDTSSAGVYRTDDSGVSWTPMSIGLPLETTISSLVVDPSDSQTIYAGTESRGVFKSTNGGFGWRPALSGLPGDDERYAAVNALDVDTADPQVVYAATSGGVATSLDGGATWREATGGPDLAALVTAPGELVAGSLHAGVLLSTDRGGTWSASDAGLNAAATMAIAVDPKDPGSVRLGTYQTGLLTTPDGGQTWSSVPALAGRTVRVMAVNPKSRRTMYIGVDRAGVLKSVDGGVTWNTVRKLALGTIDSLAIDPRQPATVYAVSDWEIFKTVDAGKSWRRLRGAGDASTVTLAVDPKRPATLYAGGDDSPFLFVSRDRGKRWTRLVAGLPRWGQEAMVEARALAVAPTTGTVYVAFDRYIDSVGRGYVGEGIYRLWRGGKRWTRITAGLPKLPDGKLAELRALAIHPRTGAVFVATNLGLYRLARLHGAWRWQLADPSFAGRTVRRIAFSPDGSRLYAATPGRLLVSR